MMGIDLLHQFEDRRTDMALEFARLRTDIETDRQELRALSIL